MILTMLERAENAVMWHLFTHGGEAPLGDVMRLDIYTPYLSKAVFNLRKTGQAELNGRPLTLRIVSNG